MIRGQQMVTGPFTQTDKQLRAALVAVVVLIATAAVALSIVLTHEDTVMAKDKPGPTTPAAATAPGGTAASGTASATQTGEQTSPVARNSAVGVAPRPSTTARSTPATPPSNPVRPPITYTVKRGDNLTVIAAWFKMRGYGDLYERNRKVIGDDPNLILPGQKITIGSRGMSTSD